MAGAGTLQNFLASENEEDIDLPSLFAKTREAVVKFYEKHGKNPNHSIQTKLKDAIDKNKKLQQQAYSETDFSTLDNKELTTYLNHRDQTLQLRCTKEINRRLDESKEQFEGLLTTFVSNDGLRKLLSLLSNAKNAESVANGIRILEKLSTSESCKEHVRCIGGIQVIIQLFGSYQNTEELLPTVYNLVANDKNKDVFRTSGIIALLIPMLSSSSVSDQILTTKILIQLATYYKAQEEIYKYGGLDKVLDLIHSENRTLQLESLNLLNNLTNFATVKESLSPEVIQGLLLELIPFKLYACRQYPVLDPFYEKLQTQCLNVLLSLALTENGRQEIGPEGIYKLMNYFVVPDPEHNIPFECFDWNMDVLLLVLKTLFNLIHNAKNRTAFFQASGPSIVISIITQPDAFPNDVILASANILSVLSTTNELRKVIGSYGIQQLMRILHAFPHNEALKVTIVNCFRTLVIDDPSKTQFFEEGGIQLLAGYLNSANHELILNACATFAELASAKFIRKVMRLLNGILDSLVAVMSTSAEEIQQLVLKTFVLIGEEEEGAKAISSKFTPALMTSLLFAKSKEVKLSILKLTGYLMKDGQNTSLANPSFLKELIKILLDKDEALQLACIQLLINITTQDAVREAAVEGGIVAVLKEFAKHENVTKASSPLVQPMRTLILTMKQIKTDNSAPGSPKPSPARASNSPANDEVWIKCVHGSNVKMLNIPQGKVDLNELNKMIVAALKLENAPASLPLVFVDGNDKIPVTSNNELKYALECCGKKGKSNTEIHVQLERKPVDSAKLDGILNQLDKPKLIKLVKRLLPDSPALVREIIREILLSKDDEEKPAASQPAPATGPPPPPPPAEVPSAPVHPRTDKPTFLDEIEKKVASGDLGLRHVDVAKEKEKTKRAKKASRFSMLMMEVKDKGSNRKKFLIDQGVVEGKQFWKKDISRWVEEVQKTFVLDVNMLQLIFNLLELLEDEITFEEVNKTLSKEVDPQQVADSLLSIGFSIKKNEMLCDGATSIEYAGVIRPAYLPTGYLLKAILFTAQA